MGKVWGDGDTCPFQCLDLVFGCPLPTGDNGARMAHPFSGRRGLSGDNSTCLGGFVRRVNT